MFELHQVLRNSLKVKELRYRSFLLVYLAFKNRAIILSLIHHSLEVISPKQREITQGWSRVSSHSMNLW